MTSEDNGRNLNPNSGIRSDQLRCQSVEGAKSAKADQTKFRDVSKEELRQILDAHENWLQSEGHEGRKADLRRANLQRVSLEGANLQDACLKGACLQKSCLAGANLQDASLEGANLQRADLRAVNLRKANLRKAELNNAHLILANLQYADLESARLQNADLRFSNLRDAWLVNANLSFADLRGTDLRGIKNLSIGQLSHVKTVYLAELDEGMRRQINRNLPQLRRNPTVPKISDSTNPKDEKSSKSNLQSDKNLRKHPRRLYSKLVFLNFKDKSYTGKLENISKFGAFIKSKNEFSRGQLFKLVIPGSKSDKSVVLKAKVIRLDLKGIGVKFESLIKTGEIVKDRDRKSSRTDRKMNTFAETSVEKRSGGDRRKNPKVNQTIDNGGRRSRKERRQFAYILHWPERRSGEDRRIGKDKRSGIDRRTASNIRGIETPEGTKAKDRG